MKSNKSRIYDFIRMNGAGDDSCKLSTNYIAHSLGLQRTNVSSLLNQLVAEGKVVKTNGRPVLYSVSGTEEDLSFKIFSKIIGSTESLKTSIQLARASILYPSGSLNIILMGEDGVGKSYFANCLFEYAQEQNVISNKGELIRVNCKENNGQEKNPESISKSGNGRQMILLQNIHNLSELRKKDFLDYYCSLENKPVIIATCQDRAILNDKEFMKEFPVIIDIPSVKDRTLKERFEFVEFFLRIEAIEIKRKLIIREELMRCLLLYECNRNLRQLRNDIKLGCANAYVREYQNSEELCLYVSDFTADVRKGFLHYHKYREEIERIIPKNYSYRFGEPGDKTHKSDEGSVIIGNARSVESAHNENNIYDSLDEIASEYRIKGLPAEEIDYLLNAEVEKNFYHYQRKLVNGIGNRAGIEFLVDKKILLLVEAFLEQAEKQLHRKFGESVFCGLSLHIKRMLESKSKSKKNPNSQLMEISMYHEREYSLSLEFAEKLKKTFGCEISREEILFMALFLCHENVQQTEHGKTVILFAFYGEGIASSIAKVVAQITKQDNLYFYEIPTEHYGIEVYQELKEKLRNINQGKGVFVVYDSNQLEEMFAPLEEELGVEIRHLCIPVTTIGIEITRKALAGENIDHLYYEAVRKLDYPNQKSRKIIVTLCSTGQGGAEEIKEYIEQYGQLMDTEVIAMSLSDTELLKEEFRRVMKRGLIQCVVGTFDPKIFSLPFIPISEIFGVDKRRLPSVLRLEKYEKQGFDYEAMFAYLEEQFHYTNIVRLKKLLPQVMKDINEKIKELPLDTEVGLFVHIACCVERLKGDGSSVKNVKKAEILKKYHSEVLTLLKILKPLEKGFGIIMDDDEIANIMTIIYQI